MILVCFSNALASAFAEALVNDGQERPGDTTAPESPSSCQPGLRVVRGPDWSWKDQDGGEGSMGTVIKVSNQDGGEDSMGTAQGPFAP